MIERGREKEKERGKAVFVCVPHDLVAVILIRP